MSDPVNTPNKSTVQVRASAVLPASGAYDTTGPSLPVGRAATLAVLVTYTPGATSTSGQPKFKLEVSADGTTWYPALLRPSVIAAGAVALTVGVYTPAPAAADAVTPVLYGSPPLDVAGAGYVRVLFAEAGDTAHPGTVAATGVLTTLS